MFLNYVKSGFAQPQLNWQDYNNHLILGHSNYRHIQLRGRHEVDNIEEHNFKPVLVLDSPLQGWGQNFQTSTTIKNKSRLIFYGLEKKIYCSVFQMPGKDHMA